MPNVSPSADKLFKDSRWLMSIVLARQPHFIGQPENVQVFWGYGLFVDQAGDFVGKKMSECSGEEILIELLGHLRFDAHRDRILASANCIPCMMPLITSQFMPRVEGDRPHIRPIGTTNLSFIGQYCEVPDDVVFTVEYSVRPARWRSMVCSVSIGIRRLSTRSSTIRWSCWTP